MAIKIKAKSEPKVEVKPVVVEEVKKNGRPAKQQEVAPVETKKENPKTTKKPAEKPVKQDTIKKEKQAQNEPILVQKELFPDSIETKKSKFQKVKDVQKGNFLFMDEGNETHTVFEVVHVKNRIYAVDVSSKGELAESIIEFTEKDINNREIDGCSFEVYQKI